MGYFTLVHFILLGFFLALFILLSVLIFKETNKKLLISMMFANFILLLTLCVFSMLIADKYTKKAKLGNIEHKRVLRNETITFSGSVSNIGLFSIDRCYLIVKMINDPINSKNIGSNSMFKPTLGLNLHHGKAKLSTVEEKFLISRNLKPDEMKNFFVIMAYPPYFSRPAFRYKLKCR